MTVFAGIAEFERDLIRERTSVGRIAAKQRGIRFGRPKKMNEEQKLLAKRLKVVAVCRQSPSQRRLFLLIKQHSIIAPACIVL